MFAAARDFTEEEIRNYFDGAIRRSDLQTVLARAGRSRQFRSTQPSR
jgi:hypothetical protein